MRTIGTIALRKHLVRQRGECTWCGGAVPNGRRSWCGQVCVDEFMVRCHAGTTRNRVWERDKGVCQRCRIDIEWLKKLLDRMWGARSVDPNDRCGWQPGKINARGRANRTRIERYKNIVKQHWGQRGCLNGLTKWLKSRGFDGQRRDLWEADHITPVVEGGGLCGLTGYRLLCVPCHKTESRELAARRAERRRIEQRPLLSRAV